VLPVATRCQAVDSVRENASMNSYLFANISVY
jgi:hypothetical protein